MKAILTKLKIIALIFTVKNLMFPRYRNISTALIYAQGLHESDKFRSPIFKENNNIFGMKESRSTPGGFIETGTARGHAVYNNLYDAVRDYFVRQNHFNISGESDEAFIKGTVKSGYATDPEYSQKWTRIFNSISLDHYLRPLKIVMGIITTYLIYRICSKLFNF